MTFAAVDGTCDTLEGPVGYRAGDAILTGVQGERWPVQRPHFAANYEPVPPTRPGQDGTYRKRPSVTLALRLDRAVGIPVGWQDSPLQGHPGDWLMQYEDGSHGVLQDDIFVETYQPADAAQG